MITFHKPYFLFALLLLISEIIIGLYLHDAFIRPYGGDFLVVILLYCVVKTFTNFPLMPVAFGVLVFAYAVEISQYFHLIKVLGLEHSRTAKLLLGTSFSCTDLFCYTLGILTVVFIENIKGSLKNF
jgi:DNA integrity scanning protein DisA with diadenylate cyclase activity